MPKQTIYTVGGTVQAGGGIYIKRKADDELLELCRQGEFAFILSSRQVGKSSLMVRTAQQLEKENIRSVTIDLSAIGVNVSPDEWYLGILNEVATSLNLKTDIFAWWVQYAQLGPAQRLTNFLKDVLLKEVKERIVLFFDEIDSTLSIPFSDDFYVALRAVYNARSTTPDFKRLSFVLVGVAAPSDLISDNKRTPFNIGRRVEIKDFTLAEALPLAAGLGQQAEQVLARVFQYTGGHPYLTQRLCAYLAASNESLDEQAVANAVDRLFTGEQGKQDNNLQFVRDMLSKRSPHATRVLLIYRDIRSGKKVLDDERSIAKAHLKLSGLVRSEQGTLRVRNQIYNSVFNPHWVNENIPRNWTKITAYSLGFVSFILLSIFIYDFIVGNLSSQYVDKFYKSPSASDKLEKLANVFNLKGILPNADYDSRARDLFFSLSATDQEDLFKASSPIAKAKHLSTVVRGLYVTMANVEGGQDSTALLQIMRDSLKNVDANLYDEIDLWSQARNAATNQDALAKYSNAIKLNGDNPATYYERAAIEIRLGLFEDALLDLDRTMALAQNLSTEAAEKEMPTPAPLPTSTRIPSANTPTTLTPHGFTETPQFAVTSAVPTKPPEEIGPTATPPVDSTTIPTPLVISTPEAPSTPTLQESYRSNFFSRAYIRSAVDLLIQKIIQTSEVQALLSEANNYPDLASNGLLPADIPTAVPTDTVPRGEPTSTTTSPILGGSLAAFSPDGRILALGSFDNTIILWDVSNLNSPTQLATLSGHSDAVVSIAFSPDAKTLASGSFDNTIILWDVSDPNNSTKATTLSELSAVTSIAWSVDGKLASGSADGTVYIWGDLPGRQQIIEGPTEAPVTSIALSAGGKLAWSTADGTVIMWDLQSDQFWQFLEGSSVDSVAFSPDGKTLALGSQDDTIILWDVETRLPIGQPLAGHTDHVRSVAFSPDGKYVVSGSDDGTARVWEASTGKEVARMTHDSSVSSVVFSPDGKYIVSASGAGTARMWEANTGFEVITIVTDTPFPADVPTPASPAIGEDWANGCISELWIPYPAIQTTENNGCLVEPIHYFFANDGRLTFLVNGRFDNTQVYGMFAPLPANGTASIEVFLRTLQEGEIWIGVFAEPTLDSEGMIIVIPPGDVTNRLLVQKTMPGQIEIQQTQSFAQKSTTYSVVFEFGNGSVGTTIMRDTVFGALPVGSTQQWLFVGFQVNQGSNRIDADFLDLVIQSK